MCHFRNRPGIDPRIAASCSGHRDAARTAREAGVGMLVLVHLSPEMEAADGRASLLGEIAEIYSGPVVLGEDLAEVFLRRSGPGL